LDEHESDLEAPEPAFMPLPAVEAVKNPPLVAGTQVADAGVRVSRLLARALAAKEVASKKMAVAPLADSAADATAAHSQAAELPSTEILSGLRAASRLKRQQDARKRLNAAAEDDGDDDDGDGGD